jgi:hypothetical protein
MEGQRRLRSAERRCVMTRKEWDALKVSGKVVELFPKDLRRYFADDFTYYDINTIDVEREKNCSRARWLRDQYRGMIEAAGYRIAK